MTLQRHWLPVQNIFCQLLQSKVMSFYKTSGAHTSKYFLVEVNSSCDTEKKPPELLCGQVKMWKDFYLAKSRSASLDMVMLVRFCWRTKMFLHIFLIPDSLILLKYWAPLIRMQEIRWPKPSKKEGEKTYCQISTEENQRKNREMKCWPSKMYWNLCCCRAAPIASSMAEMSLFSLTTSGS